VHVGSNRFLPLIILAAGLIATAVAFRGGLVAAVRVSYILLEQTRFSLQLNRDVEYSFEAAWPKEMQQRVLQEWKNYGF